MSLFIISFDKLYMGDGRPSSLHYKQISFLPYKFDLCLLFLKRWTKGTDLKNSDVDFWHQTETQWDAEKEEFYRRVEMGFSLPCMSKASSPWSAAGRPSEPSVSELHSQEWKTLRSGWCPISLSVESLNREQRTVSEKHTWNCHRVPCRHLDHSSIKYVFCSYKTKILSAC